MSTKCNLCNTLFKENINFCSKCGNSLSKSNNDKASSINLIIAFYITMLLFSFTSSYIYTISYSFTNEIITEIIFAFLVLGFSLFGYKKILKLYRIPDLGWKVWLFAIVFPIISSVFVNFFVDFLNSLFSLEETENYYTQYVFLEYPLFWSILFIAILPPIFEELAFRGFLFNQLKKVISNKQTIVATAFIFALIHFSVISFIWIFPFGLVLGYLRSKYNTLWLGMLVHFIHNLIIVFIDYTYLNI